MGPGTENDFETALLFPDPNSTIFLSGSLAYDSVQKTTL